MRGAITFDVRSNIGGVMADMRAFGDAIADKAIMRALNRALDQSATATSREIRKVYNLRHRTIMGQMDKKKATRNSLAATLVVGAHRRGRGFVGGSGRIGLIEFDATWSRRRPGASVKVMVAGGRKMIAHSFITTVRSGAFAGYRGVAIRKYLNQKGERSFVFLRGMSIPQSFLNAKVQKAVKTVARESFEKNFAQQVRHLTGRAAD